MMGGMETLALTPDELLTTTRAVRKRLDLDRPVELAVVEECLRIALQAPSGSNAQRWHWVVLTDPEVRAAVGGFYRRAVESYRESAGFAGRLHRRRPGRGRRCSSGWATAWSTWAR